MLRGKEQCLKKELGELRNERGKVDALLETEVENSRGL